MTQTQQATSSLIEGAAPTIFVSNMDRAVRFYTDTLGLSLHYRAGDEFAMIDAGKGQLVGLHPPSPKGPKPGAGGSIQVGFNVSRPIDEVVAALAKHGVKFDGPVVDDGSVKLAFFGDPDGNTLYLCEVKPC